MKGSWKTLAAFVSVGFMLVFVAASAGGTGTGNGDFERGDLTNWNEVDTGGGIWETYSGNTTPLIGIPFYKPPQGTFAATTEQEAPSQMVLYRSLPLGFSKTQQVSFYLYYQQDGLDFSPGLQEYRIDILRDGSDPTSTDPGDILKTLFITNPGDKLTMKPKLMTYVLKHLSGSVIIRFMVTVEFTELNAGLDKLKLQSAS